MRTLQVKFMILVLSLFVFNSLIGIANAGECQCWRYNNFGGCRMWDCDPFYPDDPDTDYGKAPFNRCPAWCEDSGDNNDQCEETWVYNIVCASGNVYYDADCSDFKTTFYCIYDGPWATGSSTACY